MPAETHMEGAPIERDEVLDLVRERLADILEIEPAGIAEGASFCLLYTSPSPRDRQKSRMPSSA